ncbi:MAG: hypothetical protein ACP5QT_05400 [Brevinematia bacterium]
MTIVINLSKPLDFFPLFDKDLPVELFNVFGGSIFEENLSLFDRHFLDSEIIVLENEIRQNIIPDKIISGKLFLPLVSFFEKIFLIVSFNNFYQNDPKIFLFPANVRIGNFRLLVDLLNRISKNDVLYSQPVIFFVGEGKDCRQLIERTELEEKVSGLEVFSAKNFIPAEQNLRKNENLFGFTEMCYLHSLRLKEIFCSTKEVAEIYFETEELWGKDSSWEEVLLSIKKLNLEEMIVRENPFILKFNNLKTYSGIRSLFDFFETDENHNLIKGNVECSNVQDSIIVNENDTKILAKNQSNILIFAKNGIERIEMIE